MNDSTPKPLKEQLNFASLFKMVTDHLASWNVYVRKADASFDVVTFTDGKFYTVSSHPIDVEAFKAALELVPELMFDIVTDSEDAL